jgi:multidrug efflux pump subunit AcrB
MPSCQLDTRLCRAGGLRKAPSRHHLSLRSFRQLGFVAILGVLALVGMIVRNSVILVDQIDTEIAHGRAPWDAVIEATLHRFRPILLTAAAAILGMILIAPTVFWGPMAYSIMGGLAVATMLTLVFLPTLYVAWFRISEPSPREADSVDLSDRLQHG